MTPGKLPRVIFIGPIQRMQGPSQQELWTRVTEALFTRNYGSLVTEHQGRIITCHYVSLASTRMHGYATFLVKTLKRLSAVLRSRSESLSRRASRLCLLT